MTKKEKFSREIDNNNKEIYDLKRSSGSNEKIESLKKANTNLEFLVNKYNKLENLKKQKKAKVISKETYKSEIKNVKKDIKHYKKQRKKLNKKIKSSNGIRNTSVSLVRRIGEKIHNLFHRNTKKSDKKNSSKRVNDRQRISDLYSAIETRNIIIPTVKKETQVTSPEESKPKTDNPEISRAEGVAHLEGVKPSPNGEVSEGVVHPETVGKKNDSETKNVVVVKNIILEEIEKIKKITKKYQIYDNQKLDNKSLIKMKECRNLCITCLTLCRHLSPSVLNQLTEDEKKSIKDISNIERQLSENIPVIEFKVAIQNTKEIINNYMHLLYNSKLDKEELDKLDEVISLCRKCLDESNNLPQSVLNQLTEDEKKSINFFVSVEKYISEKKESLETTRKK